MFKRETDVSSIDSICDWVRLMELEETAMDSVEPMTVVSKLSTRDFNDNVKSKEKGSTYSNWIDEPTVIEVLPGNNHLNSSIHKDVVPEESSSIPGSSKDAVDHTFSSTAGILKPQNHSEKLYFYVPPGHTNHMKRNIRKPLYTYAAKKRCLPVSKNANEKTPG